MVVRPGVTYSRATVEQILARARARRAARLSPERLIEGYVPNTALETILSRHTFQSQATRDVLDALKQFTKEGGVSEGEQPLEEYVQAMKASMVERMHQMHTRQMVPSSAEPRPSPEPNPEPSPEPNPEPNPSPALVSY